MDHHLEQAYLDTTYVVFSKEESFNLKIELSNLKFKDWCLENNIKSWAIITAFNPFSEELTKKKNKELNDRLKKLIIESNLLFNYARGVPSDLSWEAEDSFFIHNISLNTAKKFGVLYKQNAIIYGLGSSAKLVWLV